VNAPTEGTSVLLQIRKEEPFTSYRLADWLIPAAGASPQERVSVSTRLFYTPRGETLSILFRLSIIMTPRAVIDLYRLHFFFAWPVLFCSGFLLAADIYGSFSRVDLCRAALIGFFG
jgi:hypothetical protein